MEAKKVLVALLASAARSGAHQLSLLPTTEALRVFLSIEGERVWILEARPELGVELLDLAREMTVEGEGEFALELDGARGPGFRDSQRAAVPYAPGR